MQSDLLFYFVFFIFVSTETETELNVEVAFSEQALNYRDNNQRLKVNTGPSSPDDKLPVSHKTSGGTTGVMTRPHALI